MVAFYLSWYYYCANKARVQLKPALVVLIYVLCFENSNKIVEMFGNYSKDAAAYSLSLCLRNLVGKKKHKR